jgi:nickel superoxide dismutase
MNRVKNTAVFFAFFLFLAALQGAGAKLTWAHCQIPCGIYGHHARLAEIDEHVATVEKSVNQIRKLAAKNDPQSLNQLVRWINNKELHAQKIQNIISEYFLAQVVKPVDASDTEAYSAYLTALADHHSVIVAAMKVKQSADSGPVQALKEAVKRLHAYYP